MRIVIVTDAWLPQVNGVVRTLTTLKKELENAGEQVEVISPADFRTVPCPSYPEIRLALFPRRRMGKLIRASQPCAIHIATEGPLGWAARGYCLANGLPFTTAYHTRFPEYVQARFGVPLAWSNAVMRRFHAPASAVMVATQSIEDALRGRGFDRIRRWSRGVDTSLFRPDRPRVYDMPRPIFLYVGRVAVEKNIEAFLSLDLPGSKVVVGDGPQRDTLQQRYPTAHFVGARFGDDLADHYADADAFVFPSRTDTFGLVLQVVGQWRAGGGLSRSGAAGCCRAGASRMPGRGSGPGRPEGPCSVPHRLPRARRRLFLACVQFAVPGQSLSAPAVGGPDAWEPRGAAAVGLSGFPRKRRSTCGHRSA